MDRISSTDGYVRGERVGCMTVEPPYTPPQTAAGHHWFHKLVALLFIIFCFELGVFLLVFPWLQAWDVNWFASFSPSLYDLWTNNYFRGALSGLGLVDIYISLAEVGRLRRFSA